MVKKIKVRISVSDTLVLAAGSLLAGTPDKGKKSKM
jgi:hypothetical protein